MNNPLDIFNNLAREDKKIVRFCLRLSKPSHFGYEIRGLLPEKPGTEEGLLKKKFDLLHGIDANFSYDMHGYVNSPDEFKETSCTVNVNPPGKPAGYIDHAKYGHVGAGWYEHNNFIFSLYIPPQIAKDIIQRRLYGEQIESDFYNEENQRSWMKLCIDVVDYDNFANSNTVGFNIIHVYC